MNPSSDDTMHTLPIRPKAGRLLFSLLCSLLFTLPAHAQEADTARVKELQGVEVVGRHVTGKLRHDSLGGMSLDLSFLDDMPRIAGNADPIRYTQLLPSVQTNSELDAGLYVQGCDNAHNGVSINGVQLYDIQHILGIFSVFNPSHYSRLQFAGSAFTASAANRLGGFIDMQRPDTLAGRVKGELSVGLISSQGTLHLPFGGKSELILSGRGAYINLLYGRWLKVEESAIRYSFCDANVTWLYRPDAHNTLWLDFYGGNDRMDYQEDGEKYDARLGWGNRMFSMNWEWKRRGFVLRQTAYMTRYGNRFSIERPDFRLRMPSGITDYGYRLSLRRGRWSAGTDWALHSIRPQQPETEGELQTTTLSATRRHSTEGSLWADCKFAVARNMELLGGLRANVYTIRRSAFFSADPVLSLLWMPGYGQFRLTANVKHQYLFRTGLSAVNLPTDFWLPADERLRPQYAYGLSAEYRTDLIPGRLQLSAGLYYKRLCHQTEYIGTPFELIYGDYDYRKNLISGKGENYGLDLMIEKRTGRLTGWMSYSLGRALRRYPGRFSGTFPAGHERIHEFNAVATWKAGRRWSFGATLVWAGGTPFTPPSYFYLQNGNLLSQFGDYNSGRLSTYIRLDVSATCRIKVHGGRESGLNFSVYNANCRHNDLFWRLKFNDGQYYYAPLRPLPKKLPFLPSINYYIKF